MIMVGDVNGWRQQDVIFKTNAISRGDHRPAPDAAAFPNDHGRLGARRDHGNVEPYLLIEDDQVSDSYFVSVEPMNLARRVDRDFPAEPVERISKLKPDGVRFPDQARYPQQGIFPRNPHAFLIAVQLNPRFLRLPGSPDGGVLNFQRRRANPLPPGPPAVDS